LNKSIINTPNYPDNNRNEHKFQSSHSCSKKNNNDSPFQNNEIDLSNLKIVINQIYVEKEMHDFYCFKSFLPRITMKQFMNKFINVNLLNQKLKNISKSSIISSINKFSGKDHEITLFEKILNNECEEEFRINQQEVKHQFDELLIKKLKSSSKTLRQNEVKDNLNEIKYSKIDEPTIKFFLQKMYNSKNIEIIKKEILKTIDMKGSINYDKLLNIILHFQIKSHEKYISRILKSFKKFDLDSGGLLSQQAITNLLLSHQINKTDINKVIHLADPHNVNRISFSQLIYSLSSIHSSSSNCINFSLLQEICSNNVTN